MKNRSKYFANVEFLSCVPSCTIDDMQAGFLELLDKLREKVGQPLSLNCAYRPKEWDVALGRSGNSRHCFGQAVDIRCKDSVLRRKLVSAALSLGMSVGVASTFVHVDIRETTPCMWTY